MRHGCHLLPQGRVRLGEHGEQQLAIASETIAGQSATTRLNGATFVDATVKLGDRGERLTAVAMHSATEGDHVDGAGEARFRFVHITDTHIIAGGTWRARSGAFEDDTAASLRRVVEADRALDPAPALAVLGGDLASPDLLHTDRVLTPEEYAPSYHPARRTAGRGSG